MSRGTKTLTFDMPKVIMLSILLNLKRDRVK